MIVLLIEIVVTPAIYFLNKYLKNRPRAPPRTTPPAGSASDKPDAADKKAKDKEKEKAKAAKEKENDKKAKEEAEKNKKKGNDKKKENGYRKK
jgi:hypothetical protein